MQITNIEVENVLGAGSVSLALNGRRLAVIAGPNASGKSSIKEAIALCLQGVSERAPKKKDWQLLVTDGAQTGTVRIQFADGGAARLALPTGTGSSPLAALDNVSRLAWSVALGNQAMSALKPAERRSLITKLLGDGSAHDKIAANLCERGRDASLVAAITPLLRAGVDAALKEAQAKARERKAQWEQITGEAWGAKKAPNWQPDTDPGAKPTMTASQMLGAAGEASQRMEVLNRQIGAATSTLSDEELAELRKTAKTSAAREARRAELAADVRALDDQAGKLERQIAAGAQPITRDCPCCGEKLAEKDGALIKFQPMPAGWLDTVRKELADKKAQLATRRTELQDATRLAGEADAAARKVAAEDAAAKVDVGELKATLDNCRSTHEHLLAEIDRIRAYDTWHKRKADALAKHQEVAGWLAVVVDLQDPTLAVAEAAGPTERFNLALAEVTAGIGWRGVDIGDDGEMRYGSRLVTFCSESEVWRADAACSLALARVAKLGMVLLDRVDVLEPKARAPLFRWLTVDSDLESVLAFCTTKEPLSMPASVATLWLGPVAERVEVAA